MGDKDKRYYAAHKEDRKKQSASWQRYMRWQVLTHYGGNPPKCKCCGESTYEFLCVDHIEGHVGKHIPRGTGTLLQCIRENFPEGFQVLCHNCNMAKGFYGICPHEKARREAANVDAGTTEGTPVL